MNYGLGKIVTGRGEQAFTITNYSNGVAFYEVGVNVTPWNYNSDFAF
ncbi:hypothetical protein RV12_GL001698 [Enterococcus quebecensis]|nr:hypothetical protein RV12_GL001698 [Enterococcus quebecensis]